MLYKTNTYALARSITYKSIWDAFAMNFPLKELGLLVPDDKREWRYFKHLNGDVHHLDTPQFITSIDTGESIELTKENLTLHKKTAAFYSERANREKIHDLLPIDYTLYIEGVFEPIPYEISIPAKDCKILNYEKSLVERQEVNLVLDIEKWLEVEHYQYMSEAYAGIHPLHVAWFKAKVSAMLPSTIETLRLSKVHTVEVHTSLIDEFLKSHKRLNTYVPYLTLEQKLFMYRNIRYIERNPGTNETFEFLVENLLTSRNIPIDGFNLAEKYTGYLDQGIVRETIGYKTPINFKERGQGRDVATFTIDEMIDKEYPLGTEHPRLLNDYRKIADERMVRSRVVSTPTKLLEVTGVDPEDVLGEKLIERLVYEWAYQSATGRYDANIDLIDPQSGSNIRMNALQSYCLFIYAYYQGFKGMELDKVPAVVAWEQEDGTLFLDEDYLEFLPNLASPRRPKHIKYFIDSHIQIPPTISSVSEFIDNVTKRWSNKLERDNYLGSQLTDYDRLEVEMMYNHNYKYRYTDHTYVGEDYKVFLHQLGINKEFYSESGWQGLCYDLLKLSVGYDSTDIIGFREIQKKLSELVVKLTSYTIQIVQNETGSGSLSMEPVGSLPGEARTQSFVSGVAVTDVGGHDPRSRANAPISADIIEVWDSEVYESLEYIYNVGFDTGVTLESTTKSIHSVMVGAEPINE